MKIKFALGFAAILVLLTGCTCPRVCMVPPNTDEPALVRITTDETGMPRATPREVVVYPNQEVIFMSTEEFSLHFIGLSPVTLTRRGVKDFESNNGEVIIPAADPVISDDEIADARSDESIKEILANKDLYGITEDTVQAKLPVRQQNSVTINYTVEINGKILDPRFRRVDN
ncbi:hypothetical protein [Teredinibacter turnerae]|uniref:hypothetical protein n=1 Tax=Teredinibacter turnerae TaxID=2426 RepID=UPI0030D367F3